MGIYVRHLGFGFLCFCGLLITRRTTQFFRGVFLNHSIFWAMSGACHLNLLKIQSRPDEKKKNFPHISDQKYVKASKHAKQKSRPRRKSSLPKIVTENGCRQPDLTRDNFNPPSAGKRRKVRNEEKAPKHTSSKNPGLGTKVRSRKLFPKWLQKTRPDKRTIFCSFGTLVFFVGSRG